MLRYASWLSSSFRSCSSGHRLALVWTLACLAACGSGPSPQEQALSAGNQALSDLQFAQAEEHFTEAIKIDSSLVSAYVGRAQVRYVQQQFDQAVEDLDRGIALDPELDTAYFLRGLSLFATDTPERALPDLERAGFSDTIYLQDRVRSHRMRAVFYMSTLQYANAIDALTEAIALQPDNPALYYERGILHNNVEQAESAIRDLERFLEVQAETTAERSDSTMRAQARRTVDSLRAL